MEKHTWQNINRIALSKEIITLGLCVFVPFSSSWAAGQDLPGLSVARLALPTIMHERSLPQSTGTPVGEKAIDLKRNIISLSQTTAARIQEVRNLYGKGITEVDSYHRLVGEIEAKLQLGTTPANPNLINLQERANSELSQISAIVEVMRDFVSSFNATLQEANALDSEIKETLLMPGALDQDHAHLLKMAEELDSFKATIQQSLNILTGNEQRQREWLVSERVHFASLCSAIEKGKSHIPPQRGPQYPQIVDLPDITPSSQSKASIANEVKQESTLSASAPKDEPKPLPPAEVTDAPEIIEDEPPVEFVPENPKVHSVPEENMAEESVQNEQALTASQVLKEREPVVVVPANQHIERWYLFATVQRVLKAPNDKIEIVNVTKNQDTQSRGNEVVSLLIEMGISADQLILKNVAPDNDQSEQVLIFKAP